MASPAVITLTSKFFHEKKQRRVTNKQHKKINETNKDVIEVGEFKKEWMAKTKYRDFEEHHLIDIWSKISENFAKTTNKQDKYL